jgi:hypothetical protein
MLCKRIPYGLKTGCAVVIAVVSVTNSAGAGGQREISGVMNTDPLTLCFAPGTSQEFVEESYERVAEVARLNSLLSPLATKYQLDGWWTATATDGGGISRGEPITLTWSVVPDGMSIPGSAWVGDATAPSNLRAFLTGIYGNEATWLALFQQVFDRWGELTGITYIYEPNDDSGSWTNAAGSIGVRGDIRISGHAIDGNYGILAYNFYPSTGDMVIDTSDSFYNDTSSNSLKFRNTVAHEHGHGLGLGHTCPMNQSKLMEPMLTTAFDGPQHDDILGSNRRYGDRFEYNETSGASKSLGAIGSLTNSNLSLDGNTDLDFFSFAADPGSDLDLTLTPVGTTYLTGPQVGQCDTGSSYNSLTIQDLAVRVLDTNGSSELASADDYGVGGSESLSAVELAGGGTYYVEVSGDSSDEAQMYELSLTVSSSEQLFSDGFESNSTTSWSSSVP